MTNRTHNDERKIVRLYYLVSCVVISVFVFTFINQRTVLRLLRRGGATTCHDFLGAQHGTSWSITWSPDMFV